MAEHGNLFCLEGDWNDNLKQRSSILPALELLELNNGIKTIYKTCASIDEFEIRINQILHDNRKYKSFDIIYLAFHGRKNSIQIGERDYFIKDIAQRFEKKLENRIIHFGSCKTLSDEQQAREFLNTTGAKAISGYSKNIDFIESTAIDILYFNQCQQYRKMHYLKEKIFRKYGDLSSKL